MKAGARREKREGAALACEAGARTVCMERKRVSDLSTRLAKLSSGQSQATRELFT